MKNFRHIILVSIFSIFVAGCVALPPEEEEPSPSPGTSTGVTPAPTRAPTVTPAPTRAPTTTPAPTRAPTATPAPTRAPSPTPSGPTPTPGVVPGVVGLPPGTPVPGRLQVWKRNVPNVFPAFNNYDAVVFLPANYNVDPNQKFPLILSLYGTGGSVMNGAHTAPGGNRQGFIEQVWDGNPLQATFPGIVIAPEGREIGGNGAVWWNVDYTARIIQEALYRYKVDPDRVVVTGLSAGGGGVDDLMIKYPQFLAGAAPSSYGAPGTNNLNFDVCPSKSINVWVHGNVNDGTFNSSSWVPEYWSNPDYAYKVRIARCAGYDATFRSTILPGSAHSGWNEWWADPEVQYWLVNQYR